MKIDIEASYLEGKWAGVGRYVANLLRQWASLFPGWRGRIGFIAPSTCERLAWEFYQVVPEGVALLIATLGIYEATGDQFKRALDGVDQATKLLAETGADFICLGGTPLSMYTGYEGAKRLVKRMEEIAHVPAATTLTATVDALTALSVKRIVIASPAPDELNRHKKKFFEDAGFQVLNVKFLNIRRNEDIRKQPMHAAYTLAREAYLEAPEAEAIYMSCGSFGGPPVIRALENDLKKPVITSNQAGVWAGLRALKIREPIKSYGCLFGTL